MPTQEQNTTTAEAGQQPEGQTPDQQRVEQLAFEYRSAGAHKYRFATPSWYQLTMANMRHWRIAELAELRAIVTGAPTLITSATAIPGSESTEKAELRPAHDWVKEAQDDGWAVMVLQEPRTNQDDAAIRIIKTKRAAVAEELSNVAPANFVLNEPAQGWEDVLSLSSMAFPLFIAVGFLGVFFIKRIGRKRYAV